MNYSVNQFHYDNGEEFINECEIDGERMPYNACGVGDLEHLKEEYSNAFVYFGSGYITYHNGTKNTWQELHHFFKRK